MYRGTSQTSGAGRGGGGGGPQNVRVRRGERIGGNYVEFGTG